MAPIHKLLNRIRWDAGFGRGEFVIGYYGRVADSIIRVPLRQVFFDPADLLACQITDAEGESHMLPFHHIREVYNSVTLIRQRHPPH